MVAHLVDRVLPHQPVRQWVLSLLFRVGWLCARDPMLLREVVRVFLREVFRCVRRLLRRAGMRGARCGSVTAIQRFGGNLGLNVDLHAVVVDGGFVRGADGSLEFHALSGLRQTDVARVAARDLAHPAASPPSFGRMDRSDFLHGYRTESASPGTPAPARALLFRTPSQFSSFAPSPRLPAGASFTVRLRLPRRLSHSNRLRAALGLMWAIGAYAVAFGVLLVAFSIELKVWRQKQPEQHLSTDTGLPAAT
jgi:hypothetical protein